MKFSTKLFTIFTLLLLSFLTSCVETVVIGSVAGGAVVVREKSLVNTRDDLIIAARLEKEFLANGLKDPGNSIDFTINEGRVLLTGILRDGDRAKEAHDVAWKVKDVKEVIDETQIREDGKFYARDIYFGAKDYIITAELEAKLLFARDVSSVNYKVTTVGGVIYLLGVADNDFEMRRVLTIASKIRGATKVINHVILQNDNRRRG